MNECIVIVEDNEESQYLMRYILNQSGYRAVGASTGQEGIDAVRREKPALVILDIQLPEMSGYDVAHELKGDELTARIPIVAVTSFAMPGDREGILAKGCEGYIDKPIDPETFVEEIEKYL
jgi:two-component system cell cycle response regulator DivK